MFCLASMWEWMYILFVWAGLVPAQGCEVMFVGDGKMIGEMVG
jgi:hypothetical protein